jgi:hypothetical protein
VSVPNTAKYTSIIAAKSTTGPRCFTMCCHSGRVGRVLAVGCG